MHVAIGAAHCFHQNSATYYKAEEILLSLGRHDITNWFEPNSVLRQVSDVIIHDDYRSGSFDADIAIIRMRRPVQFTKHIRPICLWPPEVSTNQSVIVGLAGQVVGWGSTDDEEKTIPRSISIPIVSAAECLRSARIYAKITSNRTFCAGRKDGHGPCHGDSGSGWALLVNNRTTLRGLVSAALSGPLHNSCDLTQYVVLTDVAKYIDWIRRQL